MIALPTVPQRAKEGSLDRDYLSFSAISLFASCPLRYQFRYLKHLPEEIVAASLVFGSSFHAGVELHFRELLAGNPAPGMDDLLTAFWETWKQSEGQEIQFAKNEDLNTIGLLADSMFRAFQDSDFARPEGTIVGVEEELRGELIPGLPDLLGRVDLLIDNGDSLLVTDFKTARSHWGEEQVRQAADQLLLYHELARSLADAQKVRLAFAVLTKTKTPELTIHPVEVDPHRITRTKTMVERVWRAIESGHFFPSPSPLKCPTCPYRQACRDWTG